MFTVMLNIYNYIEFKEIGMKNKKK